ncbi:hypothetical protein NJB1907Z4_C44720 [Mycobacterium pseudoshottsii]|uniref:Uncharacterized protein n=1 Tax=Mycobacterium pseudoshottsii TaxID=265949 RepID=A0A9N7LVV7_9MYCO|nr:hypothetical protein NJB1907Z4_C44720 [Mycobacterium pseudoshottsii]
MPAAPAGSTVSAQPPAASTGAAVTAERADAAGATDTARSAGTQQEGVTPAAPIRPDTAIAI